MRSNFLALLANYCLHLRVLGQQMPDEYGQKKPDGHWVPWLHMVILMAGDMDPGQS